MGVPCTPVSSGPSPSSVAVVVAFEVVLVTMLTPMSGVFTWSCAEPRRTEKPCFTARRLRISVPSS